MFNELESVVLTSDISDYGLKAGDIGTVVHVYKNGKAVEVEFVAASGRTVALLTLAPKDIRPVAENELLHVRGVASM